jgi:hypothetical protein
MNCEHKFVHLETKKTRRSDSWYDHFKRIDTFFCEKCLEEKVKIKEIYSRDIPDWY